MRFNRHFHICPTRPSREARRIQRRCALRDFAVSAALTIAFVAMVWLVGCALRALWIFCNPNF